MRVDTVTADSADVENGQRGTHVPNIRKEPLEARDIDALVLEAIGSLT